MYKLPYLEEGVESEPEAKADASLLPCQWFPGPGGPGGPGEESPGSKGPGGEGAGSEGPGS